jgi:hypothetical protein
MPRSVPSVQSYCLSSNDRCVDENSSARRLPNLFERPREGCFGLALPPVPRKRHPNRHDGQSGIGECWVSGVVHVRLDQDDLLGLERLDPLDKAWHIGLRSSAPSTGSSFRSIQAAAAGEARAQSASGPAQTPAAENPRTAAGSIRNPQPFAFDAATSRRSKACSPRTFATRPRASRSHFTPPFWGYRTDDGDGIGDERTSEQGGMTR